MNEVSTLPVFTATHIPQSVRPLAQVLATEFQHAYVDGLWALYGSSCLLRVFLELLLVSLFLSHLQCLVRPIVTPLDKTFIGLSDLHKKAVMEMTCVHWPLKVVLPILTEMRYTMRSLT